MMMMMMMMMMTMRMMRMMMMVVMMMSVWTNCLERSALVAEYIPIPIWWV